MLNLLTILITCCHRYDDDDDNDGGDVSYTDDNVYPQQRRETK